MSPNRNPFSEEPCWIRIDDVGTTMPMQVTYTMTSRLHSRSNGTTIVIFPDLWAGLGPDARSCYSM
eukprot:2916012-Amphidinium_carterae.3